MTAHECRTCGATKELDPVSSHALADGAERTQWFCTDTAACNGRRFPELAQIGPTTESEPKAARDEHQIGR